MKLCYSLFPIKSSVFVVVPREEWLVWWFTMPNWRWRLGMLFGLAVVAEVLVLYAAWVMDLALFTTLACGVAFVLIVWCSTLLAWRR